MARLIQFGNPKIQNRKATFHTPRISSIQPRLIKFTLVFVDEILHKHSICLKKITTFILNDNQPTQLSILADQEIRKYRQMKGIEECNFHFFNFVGDEINNYQPSIEVYYVSKQDNINWINEKRFSYQLKQIRKLEGLSTTQNPQNTTGLISQIPSFKKIDQILPQNSFRTRCLQKDIQSLEFVSENAFLNSRQSSDPFIITNFKLKSKPTTQSFSIQKSKLEIKSPRKTHFDKEEQYFLQNIQQCEEELNEYLAKMKSNLSKDNDQVDKIIQFYEQVSYPTPKSRALEAKQIYTSNYISTALGKILQKTNIKYSSSHNSYDSKTKRVLSRTPQLSLLNIPNLQQQYRLNRNQLYQFYSLYKVLHLITAYQQQQQMQTKGKHNNNTKNQSNETLGITYEVYRNGIETIQDQSENIARGIFDIIDNRCSGFLDWQQFIFLMSSVQAKTREQRIDLFIKIADSDHNGVLSFQEVVKLSLQTLQKFIHTDDDHFLEEMSQFFSRIIFDSVGIQYDSDIEFNQLKEIITQGHPNSDLLCMFCGAE